MELKAALEALFESYAARETEDDTDDATQMVYQLHAFRGRAASRRTSHEAPHAADRLLTAESISLCGTRLSMVAIPGSCSPRPARRP
jgi:hypothetical protein